MDTTRAVERETMRDGQIRPRAGSPVIVDWAALRRHTSDVTGHDWQSATVWPKASALAEGARRRMSPGSSQVGLRETLATASYD